MRKITRKQEEELIDMLFSFTSPRHSEKIRLQAARVLLGLDREIELRLSETALFPARDE